MTRALEHRSFFIIIRILVIVTPHSLVHFVLRIDPTRTVLEEMQDWSVGIRVNCTEPVKSKLRFIVHCPLQTEFVTDLIELLQSVCELLMELC